MSEDQQNNASNNDGPAQVDSTVQQAGSADDRAKKLEEELTKAKNDHLYSMAEFDNFRKRTIKERSDLMKYAGERAFVELLNVLDNFERALSTEVKPENVEVFRKGIGLIAEEFRATLEKFGVTPLNSEGQPFDPNIHEALGSEETDQMQPGFVSKVFRKPYKMHDKVIRPGQVIVAKAKTGETPPTQ